MNKAFFFHKLNEKKEQKKTFKKTGRGQNLKIKNKTRNNKNLKYTKVNKPFFFFFSFYL